MDSDKGPALTVTQPGFSTTLQDFGRFGYQELGMPVAGALDPVGLRLANALVGNRADEGCLEIAYAGPTLKVEACSVRLAVYGAARLTLTDVTGAARALDSDRSHLLRRGETLAVGSVGGSSVAYLAIAGGLAVTPFLGSVSTYVRAAIGPLGGRPLQSGLSLPLRRDAAPDEGERVLGEKMAYGEGPIRVIPGPQEDHFTPEALSVFLSASYSVGNASDRMGLRLDGPVLAHRGGADIASDALISGCIQVPGTGHPIILLADHQTTGGYAKIATVISADLPRLGRTVPGSRLGFAAVTMEEAEAARQRLEDAVRRAEKSIFRLSSIGVIDLDKLYTVNLLSGVVDALEPLEVS